jgi:hypothetical protein
MVSALLSETSRLEILGTEKNTDIDSSSRNPEDVILVDLQKLTGIPKG